MYESVDYFGELVKGVSVNADFALVLRATIAC